MMILSWSRSDDTCEMAGARHGKGATTKKEQLKESEPPESGLGGPLQPPENGLWGRSLWSLGSGASGDLEILIQTARKQFVLVFF